MTKGKRTSTTVSAETGEVVTGNKPLRCPYCRDEFSAELVYTARYSEHRDLRGYECDNYACDARWDARGNPTRAPGLPS